MANALHLLEGRWIIRGTTFPLWLSQKRHNPTIKYEKLENDPLQFLDIVNYQNAKGQTKEIIGIDTYKQNHFIWRGRGLLRFLSSKWSVLAVTDIILVIKFERSLVTPAGIDVLVRENSTLADPKQLLSTSLAQYALTVNEFDRLVWL
ncbi:hypothetical protein UAY_03103 [Enterococcus moraviensis ATCC BAA-383]|uniref:Uncharacterized protein n=1 Tax=Enterococcus moraviensis ATCC BAA-383 TaxID=1158609 RepID=R2QGL5_9ENTE|nr:hypothetical protein [Enterococcus moraviensis]EOH95677.1 hypothetical protein UAY_03103 [Enterococcus moraviensis ATCC BAA-383]EOT66164.1 hypothetical protein I586_02435 [Enterococcus moraviensis ATCC BAA-383]OJG67771.1 hypothetical protein RV09_GL002540 [Enterococcus moraviensis]